MAADPSGSSVESTGIQNPRTDAATHDVEVTGISRHARALPAMAEQGGCDAEQTETCRLGDWSVGDRDGDVGISGVNARIVIGDAATGDRELECPAGGEGIVVAEVVVAEEDIVRTDPCVSKGTDQPAGCVAGDRIPTIDVGIVATVLKIVAEEVSGRGPTHLAMILEVVAVKFVLQGLDESQIDDIVPSDTVQGVPGHGPNDGLQVLARLDRHDYRGLAGGRGEHGGQEEGENAGEDFPGGWHDNCGLSFASEQGERKANQSNVQLLRLCDRQRW